MSVLHKPFSVARSDRTSPAISWTESEKANPQSSIDMLCHSLSANLNLDSGNDEEVHEEEQPNESVQRAIPPVKQDSNVLCSDAKDTSEKTFFDRQSYQDSLNSRD